VSSTATTYLGKVNQNFPVKGQDNDSQGFRDNFHNLVEAIRAVDERADNLELYAIKTDSSATFLGNTFEDVNFKNTSKELYEYDQQNGFITINYELGHYHKFEVGSGSHTVDITNWPISGKSGRLTISISTPAGVSASVTFNNSISLGPDDNPFDLLPGDTTVFEVWNEGEQTLCYVKKINDFVFDGSTTTTRVWMNELLLGNINDAGSSNLFVTGTNNVTVVSNSLRFGELALVPNRITVEVIDAITDSPTDTSATVFAVNTTTNIQPGAFVNFDTTYATSTVTSVDSVNNQVTVFPAFPVGIGTGTITFTNPTFGLQPVVVTMVETAASAETGRIGNYKGSIYARKNNLEITFAEFGGNQTQANTNTFVVSTMPDHTDVYNTSTDLASASFVHNILPFGSIIMWYGISSNVPTGWQICDGTNGTPDLRNRFVIGADADNGTTATTSVTGTNAIIGGSADATLVEHTHVGSSAAASGGTPSGNVAVTVVDEGHSHVISNQSNDEAGSGKVAVGSNTPEGEDPVTNVAYTNISVAAEFLGDELAEHEHTLTINTAGSSATGMNLPPFRALYYIMKMAG
jgi:hypothetical protein